MTRHQDYPGKPEAILSYALTGQQAAGRSAFAAGDRAAVGIVAERGQTHAGENGAEGAAEGAPPRARRTTRPNRWKRQAGPVIDLAKLGGAPRPATWPGSIRWGPATTYEAVNAAAARRHSPAPPAHFRWWQFDWSPDPGLCRSDVEYEAFFTLFRKSWRFRGRSGGAPAGCERRCPRAIRKSINRPSRFMFAS
ncbi:MAG: hypothetical protein IPK19_27830 [Chloroflexi bacterium]|nr:hypothetical protein [Chloroflexota bacterium]